jgi:type I restriction enzyme S subunit
MHEAAKLFFDEVNARMKEWDTVRECRLDECCDILTGANITKAQLSEDGTVPVYSGGLSLLGYHNEANRKANTTIITKMGTAGRVLWSDEEFYQANGCYALYPKEGVLDRYLFHYMQNKEPELQQLLVGSIPNLMIEFLANVKVEIPCLRRQQYIVNVLDTMYYEMYEDEDSTEKMLEKLKEEEKAVQNYIFGIIEEKRKTDG